MSVSKIETDIILNKANVALARSQRLVASWLPPPTDAEQANVKSEEELQKEEDEIFTAVPETLGVGAPLPQKAADGSWNRMELDSNDKLRKQLLGKNYKKVTADNAKAPGKMPGQPGASNGNALTPSAAHNDDDDDDDDEGRTALVGKKHGSSKKDSNLARKRKPASDVLEEDDGKNAGDVVKDGDGDGDDTADKLEEAPITAPRSRGRKKGTSFLDEILGERSKKRKKR
ncbi:DUF3245 domain-containing protein [Aspergillus clavatus NRRL 1]|uniref:Uncharacterized protein n=1 Tax=Aspergillus clavatus (strain ATCC 1007 / CBS 513.65 / DSM 816 / NCTC 3887 / NRRL 1 / QM 1276 / 107) TaxID=344612 RepID=A1C917_ASPCL|nr:uncharacterized protein ACLA_053870 [Aspergillus clavatus NRRL 1]EAW13341.1 conserved hypothetical protein [Aspergillus clavatus NRRL 1]